MQNICWELPQVNISVSSQSPFHVKPDAQGILLVAGGRAPDADWLRKAGNGRRVFCADRGAAYCRDAGVNPLLVVGDGDSTGSDVYAWAESVGAQIRCFPPAKDDTDLQLLLKYLPEGDILATGIWGGRFDHLYSNVFSLLSVKEERKCSLLMADERETMLLLPGGESARITIGDAGSVEAISLLPLCKESRVDLCGTRWPLRGALLTSERPYAISNELAEGSDAFSCTCHEGALGVYIKFK